MTQRIVTLRERFRAVNSLKADALYTQRLCDEIKHADPRGEDDTNYFMGQHLYVSLVLAMSRPLIIQARRYSPFLLWLA
jgi:hypothetical protein